MLRRSRLARKARDRAGEEGARRRQGGQGAARPRQPSLELLREGKPARLVALKPEEEKPFAMLGLLTAKPVLYVCNVEEASAAEGNAYSARVFERAKAEGAKAVVVSARIESEVAMLPPEDQREYLEALGLTEPGLNRVIRAGYELLGLITYSPSARRKRAPGR